MEYSDLSRLYSLSSRRVRDVSIQYFRHLMSRIDWKNRLILLMGARGTGKTTPYCLYRIFNPETS